MLSVFLSFVFVVCGCISCLLRRLLARLVGCCVLLVCLCVLLVGVPCLLLYVGVRCFLSSLFVVGVCVLLIVVACCGLLFNVGAVCWCLVCVCLSFVVC